MNTIKITSQKQLDELPIDYDGKIYIKFGTPNNPAIIRNKYTYPVAARGNSSVEAWENSSVEAWENSSVVALENSSVVAWENSCVVARGNSSVAARDNSSVAAYDNSSVEAWENSSVVACGNSSIAAYDNSSVAAYDNSSVVASGNAQVADSSSSVEIKTSGNARIVHMPRTISEYLDFYGIESDGKTAKLYKAVHKIDGVYRSDWMYECTYAPGKVTEAYGLDKNPEEDCGQGIHMAHLDWCLLYGSDWSDLAIIEVEAEIDGIIVPMNGNGKVRAAQCKMIREVPLEECGIYGKILAKRRNNA